MARKPVPKSNDLAVLNRRDLFHFASAKPDELGTGISLSNSIGRFQLAYFQPLSPVIPHRPPGAMMTPAKQKRLYTYSFQWFVDLVQNDIWLVSKMATNVHTVVVLRSNFQKSVRCMQAMRLDFR